MIGYHERSWVCCGKIQARCEVVPFRFGNKFILNGFESSLIPVSLLPPIPPTSRGGGWEEGRGEYVMKEYALRRLGWDDQRG